MPDNWGFVAAAYGLTAVVLALYWRHLVRKEKEVRSATATKLGRQRDVAGAPTAPTERAHESSTEARPTAERNRQPSRTAHPRSEPGSRQSLQ
jgi:hypothetical protein